MLDDAISNIDSLNLENKPSPDDLAIKIPLRIDNVLHDLYLAGNHGISLQRAVGYIEYLNGQLDRGIYSPCAGQDREYLRSCYIQIRGILKSVKKNFGLLYQAGDREPGEEAEPKRKKDSLLTLQRGWLGSKRRRYQVSGFQSCRLPLNARLMVGTSRSGAVEKLAHPRVVSAQPAVIAANCSAHATRYSASARRTLPGPASSRPSPIQSSSTVVSP